MVPTSQRNDEQVSKQASKGACRGSDLRGGHYAPLAQASLLALIVLHLQLKRSSSFSASPGVIEASTQFNELWRVAGGYRSPNASKIEQVSLRTPQERNKQTCEQCCRVAGVIAGFVDACEQASEQTHERAIERAIDRRILAEPTFQTRRYLRLRPNTTDPSVSNHKPYHITSHSHQKQRASIKRNAASQ